MKNYVALVLILCSTTTLVLGQGGQRSRSHEVMMQLNYTIMKNTFRVEGNVGYVKLWGRHSLGLSAIITLRTDHAESQISGPKLTGVSTDYQYQIPTMIEALDINLSAGLGYRLISNTWSANQYVADEGYVPMNTSSLEHFIDGRLGYGLRFWISNVIFVEQRLQAGLFSSTLVPGRSNVDGGVSSTDPQHDFRRYGDTGWLLQASISVGFRF